MGRENIRKKNRILLRTSLAILFMVSLLCAVPVSGGSRAQAASNGGSSKVNLCVKKSTKLELNNVFSKVTWKSSKRLSRQLIQKEK